MRVLIAMATHDLPTNGRAELTDKTLAWMPQRVFENHDFYVIANGYVSEQTQMFADAGLIKLIENNENIGTARAINQAWKNRTQGQYAIKMDNDVLIHDIYWVEQMVEAMERDLKIGILGLKRKDVWEHPRHENIDLRSEMRMLPHENGQRWIIVEKVHHVIGTCQMYSPHLLGKMGYLYQPSLYGYDDVIACHKSEIAGFYNAFLSHIEIDHIDPGNTEYTDWKTRHSGEVTGKVIDLVQKMKTGLIPIYQPYY